MTPSTFNANWLSMTTLITKAVLGDGVITSCRITSKSRDDHMVVTWVTCTLVDWYDTKKDGGRSSGTDNKSNVLSLITDKC